MKKRAMLFMFLTIVVSVFSFQNPKRFCTIMVSSQQAEAYQNRVREEPGEYSFNPMHVGDKWWYLQEDVFGSSSISMFRHVYSDSLYDGKTLFKVSGISGSQSTFWIYNQGDSVFAYDQSDADNNETTNFVLNENFGLNTIQESDLTYRSLGYDTPLIPTHIHLQEEPYYTNVFGEMQETKTIVYQPDEVPMLQTVIWSRKFGPLCLLSELVTYSLVACQIDGVFYGDQSVDNYEEPVVLPQKLDVQLYPNPCRGELHIQVVGGERKANNTLSFYNVKGQLVASTSFIENMVELDMKDLLSSSSSSGIYFCKVQSQAGIQIKKFMYIR